MIAPQQLDRAGIAQRIPHQGSMCLLDALLAWTPSSIHASAISHRDASHPMRTASGLLAPCAIEYAAQAMALHGSLVADDAADAPTPGFIASVRSVQLHVPRLDDITGALQVHAERLSGDASQVLYAFAVRSDAGQPLAEGRAVVVLNTPLADLS